MITFFTTYALILPAITVEKDNTGEVAGMYLEKTADQDVLQEENALEPIGVSVAADMDNAVTFAYSDDDMTAAAVFSTDEEIPKGTELIVNPVAPESEEYEDLRSRSESLLDKEFIYDVTTCSFYDFALICDNVDVTPKTGLVDIHIVFGNNTVEHVNDMLFAGRFARPAEEDELVSVNSDESSVIELADGIITSIALKGNDLARNDSIVGILAGNVDEETKAAAAETDAEIPDNDGTQEESEVSGSTETDGEEISIALLVKTLKASGSDYTVTLSYDESSGIPDEAVLDVSEIAQDSEEYQTYLKEAKKAMGLKEEETLPSFAARFFDIKIMVGNQEFTPETGVSVEITYNEPLAEHPDTEVSTVHFADESAEAEVIEANTAEVQDDGKATVEFTAESFSVYGVIYTVDFHWEVNGKTYDFSIPGGGFVSLEHLVEVLGIGTSGTTSKSDDKNSLGVTSDADNENASNAGKVQETCDTYDEAIKLNEVEVSEETKRFVAEIENVKFSNPKLVWAGKINEEATVGKLKKDNGLEVSYSAELKEDKISEIDAQTVEAGDWALIGVRPFTSEEMLTVTMKNGEQFAVKVTDAQISTHVITADGKDYEITVTYGPEAGIPDGAKLEAKEIRTGSSAYTSLIQKTCDAVKDETFADSITFARFFDIEILVNDKKIEPKRPVEVNIRYLGENTLPKNESLFVIHFGEKKTDIISDISVNETGDGITYMQDSFSTTGTIVSGDSFEDGKYFIVHKSGDKYYALLNNGGTVEVSYDADRKTVIFQNDTVAENALWDIDYAGTYFTWDYYGLPMRLCSIRGQNGNYIDINGSNIMGGNEVINLTAQPMNDNTGGFQLHNISVHLSGWIGTDTCLTFTQGGQFSTSDNPDNATRIQLAKYEVSQSSGQPPEVGTYTGKEVDRLMLDEWLMSLFGDEPVSDDQFHKTAEVYDYDNRIYQIDLTAQTTARVIMNNMDVAFSLDMSNSMLFPAELTPIGSVEMKQQALIDALDEGEVYFVVSDVEGTATVNALFYEGGSWKYEDASKYAKGQRGGSNQDYVVPDNRTKINTEKDNGYYTLYTAEPGYVQYIKTAGNTQGDKVFRNPYNRLTDLNEAITTAFNFMDIMAEKYGVTIRVGWNGFARDVQRNASGESYDYSAVHHPLADLETVNYRDILSAFTTGQTGGGTRPDRAFIDAGDNMGWSTDSNTERLLILVTDGAPQGGSQPSGGYHTVDGFTKQLGEAIYQGQQLSSNKDVDIITLGLSTEHVKEANDLFEHIAYTPAGGEQMKYQATDGIALRYALIDAIQSITTKAVIAGNITDTIDTAFYPVGSDGTPLEPGDWITLDGTKMRQKNPSIPHGVIGKNTAGDWTVTWTNQDIIWADDNHPDGWHGKVLVKTKEDFLGGNSIPTNEGNAQLDLTGLREKGKTEPAPFSKYFNMDSPFNAGWEDPQPLTASTPHVNVDDLFIPPQETKWEVYLKTEVDPLTQIKELYKNINVVEVVKQDSADPDHRMSEKEDMVYDLTSANDPETIAAAKADGRQLNGTPQNLIPLSDYLIKWTSEKKDLTDAEWQTLLSGGTVARVYSEYDHTPGVIKLALTKVNGSYNVHEAVTHEEYVLTAKYEPYDAEDVEYNRGEFRTKDSGQSTDEINSTHKHIIDE